MLELLALPFVKNAIIGGILLSILLSVLSLFIYMKNWSFITVGISHATFGGLALGVLLGVSPTYVALIFAIIVGFLIGHISRKGNIKEDISIGILFSLSMALGVVFLSLTSNYSSDLFAFLFGNILTITEGDIYLLTGFLILSLGFIYLFFQKIMFCCYNEEVAYVSGINTTFYYYSLVFIISIATVLSVKLVGVILASAMMILPTALSKQIFWHYKKILIFSILMSIFIVLFSIYISYQFDTPPGATIVVIYSTVFFLTILLKNLIKILR